MIATLPTVPSASATGGLWTAYTGIAADERAMGVESQNVSNVGTPEYRDQSVLFAARAAWSGVEVAGTSATATPQLDAALRSALGRQSADAALVDGLQSAQALLNDQQSSGLQNAFNQFWSAWAALASNPTSTGARQGVLAAGSALAQEFRNLANELVSARQQLNARVTAAVPDINDDLAKIASLDRQIAASPNNPDPALLAQRDSLVDALAKSVGARAVVGSDGVLRVYLDQYALIDGSVAASVGTALNGSGDVVLTVNGAAVSVSGGQVGGWIAARDSVLLPAAAQLDALAANLITTVNAAHTAGYDLSGAPGLPFFSGSSAGTIAVAISAPNQIAASGVSGAVEDGSAASAIAALGNPGPGTLTDQYANLVSFLGGAVKSAQDDETLQSAVASSLSATRANLIGVSLDESAARLAEYQQALSAAAQVFAAINRAADSVIAMVS
jgi:flagellar hook-associated protein 1 FlgK